MEFDDSIYSSYIEKPPANKIYKNYAFLVNCVGVLVCKWQQKAVSETYKWEYKYKYDLVVSLIKDM